MIKEELENRAREYLAEHSEYSEVFGETFVAVDTLTAMVEFSKQETKELKAQIEKMKCCMKCEHWYYYKSFCDKDNSYHSEGQSCEHFILRR